MTWRARQDFCWTRDFHYLWVNLGWTKEANTNDNKFMNCFLSYASELDFDWAIWALTGSYYIREGTTDMEGFDGLLNFGWSDVRNPGFLQRISTIQSSFKVMVRFCLPFFLNKFKPSYWGKTYGEYLVPETRNDIVRDEMFCGIENKHRSKNSSKQGFKWLGGFFFPTSIFLLEGFSSKVLNFQKLIFLK